MKKNRACARTYDKADYNKQKELIKNMSMKEIADKIRIIRRGCLPDYNFTGSEYDFYAYELQMVMSRAADIIDNWKSDYEELKKIKERNIPQKPTLEGDGYAPDGSFVWDTWLCPNCGSAHEVDEEKYDYCPNCGQKIDWREDDVEWKVE